MQCHTNDVHYMYILFSLSLFTVSVPDFKKKAHKASCGDTVVILSNDSDIEVVSPEQSLNATPGRSAPTSSHSVDTPSMTGQSKHIMPSNGYNGYNYGDSGGFQRPSYLSGSSSGYGSQLCDAAFAETGGATIAAFSDEGECPLCFRRFPLSVLEHHADSCASLGE